MRRIMFFGLILFVLACFAGYVHSAEVCGLHNVKDYGAVGNGITDDTANINSAITAAIADNTGVYFPEGRYKITSQLNIYLANYGIVKHLTIKGEHSTILAGADMEAILHLDTTGFLHVQDLYLDCDNKANHGIYGYLVNYRTSIIEDIAVINAKSHGFDLMKCQSSVWRNCSSTSSDGSGWNITDCNAAVFDSCASLGNLGDGFTLDAKDLSGGCILNNFWSEGNSGNGVLVSVNTSNATVVIRSGWIENNILDGIRIESNGTDVTACQIFAAEANGNKAIRLTSTSRGTRVSGCHLQRSTGSNNYSRVRVECSPVYAWVQGNFYRYGGAPCPVEDSNGTAFTLTNWYVP